MQIANKFILQQQSLKITIKTACRFLKISHVVQFAFSTDNEEQYFSARPNKNKCVKCHAIACNSNS